MPARLLACMCRIPCCGAGRVCPGEQEPVSGEAAGPRVRGGSGGLPQRAHPGVRRGAAHLGSAVREDRRAARLHAAPGPAASGPATLAQGAHRPFCVPHPARRRLAEGRDGGAGVKGAAGRGLEQVPLGDYAAAGSSRVQQWDQKNSIGALLARVNLAAGSPQVGSPAQDALLDQWSASGHWLVCTPPPPPRPPGNAPPPLCAHSL